MRTILGWLIVIWLAIGAFAGYERGYYEGNDPNCAKISTISLTVVAGPLNYAGVNPKVNDCKRPPKPSN